MSRQRLSQGQRQPLARRVLGHVGGLLDDVHALEVLPEGMRRIRQPARREGVGLQQVAEFIVNIGMRAAAQAESGRGEKTQQANQEDGRPLPPRHLIQRAMHSGARAEPGGLRCTCRHSNRLVCLHAYDRP